MTPSEQKIEILKGRLEDVTAEKEDLEARMYCDLGAANNIIDALKKENERLREG